MAEANMNNQKIPLIIRIYFICYKGFQKPIKLLTACFSGFWLGVLEKETLHFIDEFYYNNTEMYFDEKHNRKNFWDWEKKVLNEYFQKCKHLLVAGVGGGREVLALRQKGYYVDGFECNPRLVDNANNLMSKEGFTPNIQLVPRDHCPGGSIIYDGLIIGWGTYMLIQGRKQRVAFLKNIRKQTCAQSPVLLSFFPRRGNERSFKVIAVIGNAIRWILRRDPVETGDDLPTYIVSVNNGTPKYIPYYVHYFTKEEIVSELSDGGFKMDFFSRGEYGHAVGIALKESDELNGEE